MKSEHGIADVAEAFQNAKRRGKSCALLIGAGCSVTAGIPSAAGFVDIIKTHWPQAYKRAASEDYPKCMAELAEGERRDLIAEHVAGATINAAHIGIAQLIKEGFVDRVLTTNFDPLVLRACAMLNIFPAVYDFAASQSFNPAFTADRAIFHLHGQHTGFVLLNSPGEVAQISHAVTPVFEDAGRNRMWLVAGYSGSNDPVFEQLARIPKFRERLYWVGYADEEPKPHVSDQLLSADKSAFYIRGFDADSFFVTLARQLGCFPPDWVEKPFSHLKKVIHSVAPLSLTELPTSVDLRATTHVLLDRAIQELEEGNAGKLLIAESHLLAGHYERVIGMRSDNMSSRHKYLVALAFCEQGNVLTEQADKNSGAEADTLYDQAVQNFAEALKLSPGMYQALFHCGNTYFHRACAHSGTNEDALYRQAADKYSAALDLKPDLPEALYNLGITLSRRAQNRAGTEADTFYQQASDNFAKCLTIRPEKHGPLRYWGSALMARAKTQSGPEADALYSDAAEKLTQAERIKPGSASYDLACVCALCGDTVGCKRWLKISRDHGTLPSRSEIEQDEDLKSVLQLGWFRRLLKAA